MTKEDMTFKNLGVCDQLVEACGRQGWKSPLKIQAEAIPHALQGKDLIAIAQTGSGKTGTFALPILQALMKTPKAFFACVLSPTRELAFQIAEQFEALGDFMEVKCAVLFIFNLFGSCILWLHLVYLRDDDTSNCFGKAPSYLGGDSGASVGSLVQYKGFSLWPLKYLVLDEADRLLNMDFEKDINEILKVLPRERRTYLFSATTTQKVHKLKRACLKNPAKVEASIKYSTADTLIQHFCLVPAKHKVTSP
ncbi:hypothetical protein H6P81_009797 [Aristolochia fimbriata]|uniref:RNA helicase n=1 Tax=Aristolochia fimbriata TaxID=158543 RepID=A0AAV7EQC6_ARIFI|nr:hypothetical protein H6P81_009797 [Aristolochia fimbriata]